jgi:hypothetical protein
MNAFVRHFGPSVIAALSGWDRLRLRGSLTWLCQGKGVRRLMAQRGWGLDRFKDFATRVSADLGRCVERATAAAGRKLIYLREGGQDKEALAKAIAQREQVKAGLVCSFSVLENCRSFRLGKDRQGEWDLFPGPRRCLHYYHYLIHPLFGWMYLRVQSWLPLSVQVGLNGREWLSRQMDQAGIGYLRQDNCFVHLQDPQAAQALAQQQVEFRWEPELEKLVGELLPGLSGVIAPDRLEYYWSMEQSEWACDTLFASEAELSRICPGLFRRGIETLDSRRILYFLGQKVPAVGRAYPSDQRAISASLTSRPEGRCLKHWLGSNSIKCYNKQDRIWRVEVTINDPSQFKVPRWDEQGEVRWMPMRKGVVDARRRAEVCQQACDRYLEAQGQMQVTTSLKELTEKLSQRVRWGKQSVRGLHLLAAEDDKLLAIVGRGEFLLHGFRNRDLQQAWFGTESQDPKERKRRSGQMTRKLRLLRAHGLVEKLPHTHRYQVTAKGRQVIAAVLAAGNADIAQLSKAA